ncbi:hypothetical protein D7316_04753 [Gordonia insulae]|uniref:Uncharacterized protein n=2 Tax=Gordonia insulae TaxID=2420509 RepID=A0A3G8JVE4_9ACTN|nr:hypothetical protein D7316_04753 [Gordonia insulae]
MLGAMSGWILAAIIITVWVTVSVIVALVVARAVRLRERNEKPQPSRGATGFDTDGRTRRDR